jgi:hypothetical protein
VNKDGDLQLCTINDAPKHPTWSNTGTLAIGNAVEYRVLEPTAMLPSSPPSHAQHMQLHEVEHNIISAPRRPRGFSSSTVFNQDRGPQKVIDTDIAVSMRTRAAKGYGLDDVSLTFLSSDLRPDYYVSYTRLCVTQIYVIKSKLKVVVPYLSFGCGLIVSRQQRELE